MVIRTGKWNLLVQRGATLDEEFPVKHGIQVALDPGTSDTSIAVEKLDHSIPINTEFDFGDCILSASSTVSIASRSIPITIVQGSLSSINQGDIAYSIDYDLTSYTSARAAIRKRFNDTAALLVLTATITGSTVSVEATALETEAITIANCNAKPEELPSFEDFQDDFAFDPKVLKRGYYWDLELVKPDGTVDRLIQGRAFVTPEATY